MWIANISWNAATLFPSLGYSYQLGLSSSHLASAIGEGGCRGTSAGRVATQRQSSGGRLACC